MISGLSEEMSSAGYKAITNIDISQGTQLNGSYSHSISVVITHMTEKYRDNPSLTCTHSLHIRMIID
jgi:hypothetical protein